MLGILGNFEKEETYKVIKSIIGEMRSSTTGDFAEKRYFNQLRILVQLRNNIGQQFEKAMESVSTFFKEENDYLYRRGEKKAEKERNKVFVTNLINESGFTEEKIAHLAEVSVDFVAEIRLEMDTK